MQEHSWQSISFIRTNVSVQAFNGHAMTDVKVVYSIMRRSRIQEKPNDTIAQRWHEIRRF